MAEHKISSHRITASTAIKIIHFVRHAQGLHNVAGGIDYDNYLKEEFEDSVLSDLGFNQCAKLNERTEFSSANLIVVSPMRRTLQTATHSFTSLKNKIPWIALEYVREQTGLHPCDRRHHISEHRRNFCDIDFSHVTTDMDPLYHLYPGEREPKAHVVQRARTFLNWLAARPEKEIIVVTHSAFLRILFSEVLNLADDDCDDFANCEVRTLVVSL